MADYRMKADRAEYKVTGGTSRATLGALYTGRSTDVGPAHARAGEWIDLCTEAAPLHKEFEAQFESDIASLAPVPIGIEAFRGRPFDAPPASWRAFGPNPNPPRGRYNWQGVPVLYLCDSELGVTREVELTEPNQQLWVQRFTLDAGLALLDARALLQTSFAAAVFWRIEHNRDRNGPLPALGPRVAQLIGERFAGMIVPGVRGDDSLYSNIVIFRPETEWESLVDVTYPPRRSA